MRTRGVRTIQTLAGAAVLVAALIYWDFGTLSPCGVLRESARQRNALATVLPDSVVDLAIAGQYGPLSPGRCLAIMLQNSGAPDWNTAARQPMPQPAPGATAEPAPVDLLQAAAQVTTRAAYECRAKRLGGELKTYVASAQCSNAAMIAAFKEAQYRYMDLIELFTAKRLALAAKIDRGELSEQQAKLESDRAYASLQAAERKRDGLPN